MTADVGGLLQGGGAVASQVVGGVIHPPDVPEQRKVPRQQPPGQLPVPGHEAQQVPAADGRTDGRARRVQRGQPGEEVRALEGDTGQLPFEGVGVALPAGQFLPAAVEVHGETVTQGGLLPTGTPARPEQAEQGGRTADGPGAASLRAAGQGLFGQGHRQRCGHEVLRWR
ncbi:hypothetical protein ACRAWF_17135 [Streptomyces sp. L7]